MQTALATIRDEHRTISAVLHAMKELAREAQGPGAAKPAFPALRAMVRYIDEFPEKLHHPKEDDQLFARLVKRLPEAKALVDRLKKEHVDGARLIRDLERALLFFEDRAPEGAKEFLEAVNAYADFHWVHMRCEEQELLPLAERCLTPEDWRAISAAFVENPDFEKAFTRIVNLAPAPVGLGAR
ncbi:MAG TPA: hemerythrin domain-containing protein [Burkholderiales bacterium]|nr:hemerythrin domain-containing protein [Burkholderiales bacterium]